jgi:cobalamin-dependent methionine synthase I
MKEKLPPELNIMIELFTYVIEITVLDIEARESSNNYEYDIASEKFMELAEKSEKILSLNITLDPSTKTYFEGTREMYHGLSDMSSAEYQSESALCENAINLCREAKQRFMIASEKFAFSQHPMAKSSSKRCLQVANTIIPKIISRYKI